MEDRIIEKASLVLTYANYPLRKDPTNFLNICEVASHLHPFVIHSEHLKLITQRIVEYALYGIQHRVDEKYIIPNIVAFEAVYGYRNKFCEKVCPDRKARENRLAKTFFTGDNRPTCCECDQIDFIGILSKVVQSIEPLQVSGFDQIVEAGEQFKSGSGLINNDDEVIIEKPLRRDASGFQELMKRYQDESFTINGLKIKPYKVNDPLNILNQDKTLLKLHFRNYWKGLIGYSLMEYMVEKKDNIQHLKKCPICSKFFVAKDLKRQICYSKECEKERNRERKKLYMRKKRDPNDPNYDERYKTREFNQKPT